MQLDQADETASSSVMDDILGPVDDTPIEDAPEEALPDEPAEPAEPASDAEEEPAAEEATEEPAPEPEDGNWFPGEDELNAEIARAARRMGHLDPANPEHLKTLKSFAEKELYIRELRGKLPKPETGAVEDGEATEFERQLRKPAEPAPQQEQPKPAAGEPVDANWRSWADPQRDLAAAWSRMSPDGKPDPDYDRITEIENAKLHHQAQAFVLPMVERLIQERFGDALGAGRDIAAQRRGSQNTELAISDLEAAPSGKFKAVRDIFKPVDDSVVSVGGKEYRNTPFVQAVQDSPHILEIRVESPDGDPDKSDRLTKTAQIRAAIAVHQRLSKPTESAKKAVEAGQRIEQRNQADRTRQGLNAGPGAGQLNGGKDQDDFVSELNADRPRRFSDL